MVELLKTNLNALATAKQLGVNHKTVLAVAKKERIDIKVTAGDTVGSNTQVLVSAKAQKYPCKSDHQCIVPLLATVLMNPVIRGIWNRPLTLLDRPA